MVASSASRICGNEQQTGVNYNDTFVPVLGLATARMVLALSVIWHCPARHGYITAAYTTAAMESNSDIYLYVPNDMTLRKEEIAASRSSPVLKLQHSLYGLKQAGRLWNNLLHMRCTWTIKLLSPKSRRKPLASVQSTWISSISF
jgi:hypothetical protein